MLVSVAFLIAFVWSGGSASLRDYAGSLVGASFIPTLAMYAVLLALLNEAISLPFAFYEGVTLERRYGLSTQTTARWWLDHLKAGVIVLAFGLIAALIVCSLIRWQPDRWWVLAAVVFTVIMVGLVQLTPVLLLHARYKIRDSVVVLTGGDVLVAGGAPVPELWRRSSGRFTAVAGTLGRTRLFAAASPLASGEVLVTGGYDLSISPTAQAWLYR